MHRVSAVDAGFVRTSTPADDARKQQLISQRLEIARILESHREEAASAKAPAGGKVGAPSGGGATKGGAGGTKPGGGVLVAGGGAGGAKLTPTALATANGGVAKVLVA